jgi:hypothetical protein
MKEKEEDDSKVVAKVDEQEDSEESWLEKPNQERVMDDLEEFIMIE